MTITVIAIDDHPAITGWVRTVCMMDDELDFAGRFTSIEAVPAPARTEVDVIVLDLLLDHTGLWDGLRDVSTWGPAIVVLSVSTDGVVVGRALRSGARAFVGKRANEDEMATCIKLVAKGASGLVFSAERAADLPPGVSPALERLLEAITISADTNELRTMLNLTANTIDQYCNRLYDALDISPRNRVNLADRARRMGYGSS
jgi:DNA-binding NarL/FixJ family response regulator